MLFAVIIDTHIHTAGIVNKGAVGSKLQSFIRLHILVHLHIGGILYVVPVPDVGSKFFHDLPVVLGGKFMAVSP